MSNIEEKLSYALETKDILKEAIVQKGAELSDEDPFRTYADRILEIETGNANYLEITTEEYNALTEDERNNGTIYFITDGDNVIILNDINYSGSKDKSVELTMEEYDALPDSKLTDDITYFIKDYPEPDDPKAYTDTKIQELSDSVDTKIQELSGSVDIKIQELSGSVDTKIASIDEKFGGLKFGVDDNGNCGYYDLDNDFIIFGSGGGDVQSFLEGSY